MTSSDIQGLLNLEQMIKDQASDSKVKLPDKQVISLSKINNSHFSRDVHQNLDQHTTLQMTHNVSCSLIETTLNHRESEDEEKEEEMSSERLETKHADRSHSNAFTFNPTNVTKHSYAILPT
jgi:hypothetical protein